MATNSDINTLSIRSYIIVHTLLYFVNTRINHKIAYFIAIKHCFKYFSKYAEHLTFGAKVSFYY